MEIQRTKGDVEQTNSKPIAMICPHCGHQGTLTTVGNDIRSKMVSPGFRLGFRKCPNRKCQGLVTILMDHSGDQIYVTFPPNQITFDKEDIPDRVLSAFEEAVTCHANGCYVAAAIMVRKSIEELCADRGATGKNLEQRIDALRSIVVLPEEMLQAMHNLRFLGNDAAHIDAKTYEQVGEAEVHIGIEATKELLHAVYQYKSLLEKLEGLQKPD